MPVFSSQAYQALFRPGVAKSIVSGLAPAGVAVTHPTHALNSQHRPSFARRHSKGGFSRLSSLGLQSAFQTSLASVASADHKDYNKVEKRHDRTKSHGGLDAYYEQLQRREASEEVADEEWVQFQFQPRIEWKPSPASILLGPNYNAASAEAADASAAQQHDSAKFSPEEQATLAHIDAAIEKEIEARNRLEALEEEALSVRTPTPSPFDELAARSAIPISRVRTPASIARSATPPVDPQSQKYADYLANLVQSGRYYEVPAVFEAMLAAEVQPIASAYNALLKAAVNWPTDRIHIVTKALDAYADMHNRKVTPDSDTYDILVGLLASRSVEVSGSKKVLEGKRLRFGGMDEPGKFMLTSHELDYAILSEDDRLDFAIKLFETSVKYGKAAYSSETYHQLISACAQSGRISDMLQLFEHMEINNATPFAATFPAMITAFARSGDLVSAVECYNEYKNLAIANDNGEKTLLDRLDTQVYAAVINAYVVSDKLAGAKKFYERITQEYGVHAAEINDALVTGGFVKGFIDRGIYSAALTWAQTVEQGAKETAMSEVATVAADHGDKHAAVAAFANLPEAFADIAEPTMALMALSVREGDVAAASRYWHVLSSPSMKVTSAFIEPTAMYAVAMIGTGQTLEGLVQSEMMFQRIRQSSESATLAEEVEEGVDFVSRYMSERNIADPREVSPVLSQSVHSLAASNFSAPTSATSIEDTFDPYAHSTDFKGSSLISDELEGSHGRRGPKLHEALTRFRNMRRAGRHPRYITYAKLISAAARDGKMDLCQDIMNMARTDVPLLPQYAVVRYGWSSILDSMVGACLTLGNRQAAEQYHQELLDMGSTPSANTFGLYITTLKESTKTFDEASEAVKIFHRAKAEGVEPSSFLYNALIGKLGKARRIDDCLFYFAEMRALGIKPTSVTYGTIVNALCRVSDEKFAEALFDEMEAMPNYKARPAPYNSMMQFFLTTKRDKSKVLAYYERMLAKGIAPTAHTYKLLVDTHATLEPVDMTAAEAVLEQIRASGLRPEAVHYASLIHARGCNMHDMEGARRLFDTVVNDPTVPHSACLYQALFEAMVANHKVADSQPVLETMRRRNVDLTPYIANTLIHGWAAVKNIANASKIYSAVDRSRREPSTYEAMTRAFLAVEERENAKSVVTEMLSRGYPSAVVNKVLELLGGGHAEEAVPVTA